MKTYPEEMLTHQVAARLKVELKLKRKVRVPHLEEYANKLKVPQRTIYVNGSSHRYWNENQFQELKTIFTED